MKKKFWTWRFFKARFVKFCNVSLWSSVNLTFEGANFFNLSVHCRELAAFGTYTDSFRGRKGIFWTAVMGGSGRRSLAFLKAGEFMLLRDGCGEILPFYKGRCIYGASGS